jgi:hypothetical protein
MRRRGYRNGAVVRMGAPVATGAVICDNRRSNVADARGRSPMREQSDACGAGQRHDAAADARWCFGHADSGCAAARPARTWRRRARWRRSWGRRLRLSVEMRRVRSMNCSVTRRCGRRWWSRQRGGWLGRRRCRCVLTFRRVVGCVGLRRIGVGRAWRPCWLLVCLRWRGTRDVGKRVFIHRSTGWRRSRCMCSWGSSPL